MKPAEQVAYVDAVFEAARGASGRDLQRALLLGLVAAHRPREIRRDCVVKFYTEDGEPGCSECERLGPPIRVETPDWNPKMTIHTHLTRDPECASCEGGWPCTVITTVRSALGVAAVSDG